MDSEREPTPARRSHFVPAIACREHDRPDDSDDNHNHAGNDVLALTEASIPRAVHELRVDSLAAGGELSSLIAALQAGERQREALEAELATLGHIGAFTTRTAKNLERQVLGKLADWRTTLRQEAPDARQVLRQLITERVTCEPTERDGQRLYAYRGRFWFGGLFEGTISPLALASQSTPNWNQIASFLESMQRLRDSVGFAG